MPYCSITSISESVLEAGVLWVGTDDGKVHVSRDHGATWVDLTANLDAAGGADDRYVSRVFASPHDAATAFVAKNGFRNDDFQPLLFRTDDYGATWASIGAGLPASPINVVVQDADNPGLLIVGNDLGVEVSIDGGRGWQRLRANLPTVPVHDLTIHPRESDLVLGSYGRGVFVADITALRQATPAILESAFHLFDIEPRPVYAFRAIGNYHLFGDAYIEVANEADALTVQYWLDQAVPDGATICVTTADGDDIATLRGTANAGLNAVNWNMRRSTAGGGRGGRGGGPTLPPGDYQFTVTVGGFEASTIGTIRQRIQ